MANYYCPIANGNCYNYPCVFWNPDNRCCVVESTLTKVSAVADAIRMRLREVENDGDTPEPHETKQKEV